MSLAVIFNLLKNTQPHYSYKPESCLENENYKLYFDRTVLTDIHIQHNRPDIIILNKQQKACFIFINFCVIIMSVLYRVSQLRLSTLISQLFANGFL
jgi:hypothetical protein